MRSNKHHTLGTQTSRQRKTGRPAPTPRLKNLTPWSPCSAHNPGAHGGWRQAGDLQPYQIHTPGSLASLT